MDPSVLQLQQGGAGGQVCQHSSIVTRKSSKSRQGEREEKGENEELDQGCTIELLGFVTL